MCPIYLRPNGINNSMPGMLHAACWTIVAKYMCYIITVDCNPYTVYPVSCMHTMWTWHNMPIRFALFYLLLWPMRTSQIRQCFTQLSCQVHPWTTEPCCTSAAQWPMNSTRPVLLSNKAATTSSSPIRTWAPTCGATRRNPQRWRHCKYQAMRTAAPNWILPVDSVSGFYPTCLSSRQNPLTESRDRSGFWTPTACRPWVMMWLLATKTTDNANVNIYNILCNQRNGLGSATLLVIRAFQTQVSDRLSLSLWRVCRFSPRLNF